MCKPNRYLYVVPALIHPHTIHIDGVWIPLRWYSDICEVSERLNVKKTDASAKLATNPPAKASETEKLTINLGLIDLGQIDLLVQEKFYTNRSDLIRTAIRNQLASHAEVIRQTVSRKSLVLGLQHYSRQDLEAVRDAGQKLRIQALGLISIAPDVTPKLASATIESIAVLGAFQASAAVKAALAGRIH
jgi:Arc/MetJ-type ribon-helix-helix transcriptional regulator